MRFSKAEASDAQSISNLALATCEQFLFDDLQEEGRDALRHLYSSSNIRRRIDSGDLFLLATDNGELLGAAAMRRDDNHVYLFFVAGGFHRQGLGSRLMQALVSELVEADHVKLNSSMYAADFYRQLGFEATGPATIINGVEFLPMKLDLQGQTLKR